MVVLDFFIVNVALPSMQSHLHAGSSAIEWVVAGYALTSAVFLMTAARLGDRFGHRRLFTLGLAAFTVSSLACGLAPNPGVLVASRLVQGAAAAMLMPNVLSIIGIAFTGEDRAKALSIYAMTMGMAAVGGQLIGGALVLANVAGLGWRTIFLINVPVGALALLATPRYVPESRAAAPDRPDVGGTALVTLALTAIVLPLVVGRQHGWPLWTWATLAAAPALLGAFALHQRRLARRGGAPLLRPELFRVRAFSAGLLAQLTFWSGQASFFLVLALYLQQGRGLDALPPGSCSRSSRSRTCLPRSGPPRSSAAMAGGVLGAGALVLASGHGLLLAAVADVGVGGSVAILAPGLALVGAGMGLVLGPLTTTIMSGLDPERAGAASGTLAATQNVGNAIGVALIGVIFFGALHGGVAHAFRLSAAALAVLLIAVAALTRLLPASVISVRR